MTAPVEMEFSDADAERGERSEGGFRLGHRAVVDQASGGLTRKPGHFERVFVECREVARGLLGRGIGVDGHLGLGLR